MTPPMMMHLCLDEELLKRIPLQILLQLKMQMVNQMLMLMKNPRKMKTLMKVEMSILVWQIELIQHLSLKILKIQVIDQQLVLALV
jgi:hypothetical protein